MNHVFVIMDHVCVLFLNFQESDCTTDEQLRTPECKSYLIKYKTKLLMRIFMEDTRCQKDQTAGGFQACNVSNIF